MKNVWIFRQSLLNRIGISEPEIQQDVALYKISLATLETYHFFVSQRTIAYFYVPSVTSRTARSSVRMPEGWEGYFFPLIISIAVKRSAVVRFTYKLFDCFLHWLVIIAWNLCTNIFIDVHVCRSLHVMNTLKPLILRLQKVLTNNLLVQNKEIAAERKTCL